MFAKGGFYPARRVERTTDVPTDGFVRIFVAYSLADSSWLAAYQNHFDRITSTVSQGSVPRASDVAARPRNRTILAIGK